MAQIVCNYDSISFLLLKLKMKPVSANYNISIIAISRYLWKALGIHFVKSWLTKIIQFSIHIMEIYKKSFNSWQHCIRQNGLVCQVFFSNVLSCRATGKKKIRLKIKGNRIFYKKFYNALWKCFFLPLIFPCNYWFFGTFSFLQTFPLWPTCLCS